MATLQFVSALMYFVPSLRIIFCVLEEVQTDVHVVPLFTKLLSLLLPILLLSVSCSKSDMEDLIKFWMLDF